MSNRAKRNEIRIRKRALQREEDKATHRVPELFSDKWRWVGTQCKDSGNKFTYLSEASCIIAIKMENKYEIVAPYKCNFCQKYHMTSEPRTVRKFYHERRAQGRRIRIAQRVRNSSTLV